MSEPLLMAQYFDAAIAALKQLEWVRDARIYPDSVVPTFSGLMTPAIYFRLDSWNPAITHDGQLSVQLNGDFHIIVDKKSERKALPEMFLRGAAADLTQWVNGQQFGLDNIEPAAFVLGARDASDPRMNDYLVWRVSFTQRAALGVDPFPAGAHLSQAWLGAAPDVGAQHVGDYHLIFEASDHD